MIIFVKPEMREETWLLHGPYRNGSTEGIKVILCGVNNLMERQSSKLQFVI